MKKSSSIHWTHFFKVWVGGENLSQKAKREGVKKRNFNRFLFFLLTPSLRVSEFRVQENYNSSLGLVPDNNDGDLDFSQKTFWLFWTSPREHLGLQIWIWILDIIFGIFYHRCEFYWKLRNKNKKGILQRLLLNNVAFYFLLNRYFQSLSYIVWSISSVW